VAIANKAGQIFHCQIMNEDGIKKKVNNKGWKEMPWFSRDVFAII